MKIFFILIVFLLINAFFIISENNLKLKNENNIKIFKDLYFSWITNIKNNITTVTGNLIKLNWIP